MHFPSDIKKTFYIRKRRRGRKKLPCHFGEIRKVNSFMPPQVENALVLSGGIKHGNLRESKITIKPWVELTSRLVGVLEVYASLSRKFAKPALIVVFYL